ncbi:MAG: hypothetical protein Q7S21_01660 [archaeon]|nr:hypothetical protein [archaeon]
MGIFRKRVDRNKPNSKLTKKQKLKRAGAIAAIGLSAWLAIKPIPKERLRGHEAEHPGTIFYRDIFKGQIGIHLNPKPINGEGFHNWLIKSSYWKDWIHFAKRIIGDKRYEFFIREGSKIYSKIDTEYLTEFEALTLHNKLKSYERIMNAEKVKEAIRRGEATPKGYVEGLSRLKDYEGKLMVEKPHELMAFVRPDSAGFDTVRVKRMPRKRKDFLKRRINRKDSRR